ncbi:MAG: peptidoglycan DD-metalloendopeptidase family protein [Cyclobacteriaceae bacterium]|nr:peptidoglycan DD-metalloendopeptidase family protein [Cyclobacteriaceae bacterium]
MKIYYWLGGVLVVLIAAAVFLFVPTKGDFATEQEEVALQPTDTLQAVPEPTFLHGILIDSMEVLHNTIKQNQYLSDILTSHNISNETIHDLTIRAKGVFDLRKMGVHKPYDLVCYNDSLLTAKAMVYYPNDVDFVIFHLEDSAFVETGSKKVVLQEKTATGVIQNSLAVTMEEMGLSPILTNDLADVFAWQIDFFRLYPGDRFKVIYDEELADGKQIGIGDIKAAVFEHDGHEYYAYYYNQGTGIDYFDDEGNSLRKAFLKYPVKFSRISSRYSGKRYHPVQKRYKAHLGTDFAAPKGTSIRTVGDGVVVEARYSKYNGNYVKIKHNSMYSTQYLHMSKIASGMRPGVHVKQGQTIGFVGSTGLATGDHVCFRFWKGGYQVDALKVQIPAAEPIKTEKMEDFKAVASSMKKELNNIAYPETSAVSLGGNK